MQLLKIPSTNFATIPIYNCILLVYNYICLANILKRWGTLSSLLMLVLNTSASLWSHVHLLNIYTFMNKEQHHMVVYTPSAYLVAENVSTVSHL